MNWILGLIIFLTTLQGLQAKSLGETYHEATKSRVSELARFQKEVIFEETVCPGGDFACVVRSLKAKRLRSTAEVYAAIQVMTGLYQKKLKVGGDCQGVCRSNLNAAFIGGALELVEEIVLKDFLISELDDSLETRLIIYGEEMALFKLLRRIGDRLLELNGKVESDKVFDGNLGQASRAFAGRIAAVQHGRILRKSSLRGLDPSSEEFGLFLRTAGERPSDQDDLRRDIEAYKKSLEGLKD